MSEGAPQLFAELTTHLVPVLLHTSFSSLRESLYQFQCQTDSFTRPHFSTSSEICRLYNLTSRRSLTRKELTLAISAQLLPASRMFFSLCSSAGVHGVFVRLFFAGGGGAILVALSSPDMVLDGPARAVPLPEPWESDDP